MNRLDRTYSFHISKIEKDSIEVLKEHNVNVSRFLRWSLRALERKLRLQDDGTTKNKLDIV